MTSNVLIVSNRLPVKVDSDGNFSLTCGGLASALSGLNVPPPGTITWIGWNGCELDSPDKQEAVREQLKKSSNSGFKFEPVFLSDAQVKNYYDGFSNASLWPILHYFAGLARFHENWFQHYVDVNRLFCDAIVRIATPADIVWVHDYHLMLLPMMLREKLPELRIGFFLHVPFPSFEIFRCIPQRKELVEGLLGADLIGFHTFSYLRHFKSCVLRCLGLECSFDTIRTEGRVVRLGIHPIGINWRSFEEAMKTSEYSSSLEEYARDFANRKLVLSVSRLDYTKGIPAMLDAIAYFLEHNPDRHDITFLVIAVPSRDAVQSYKELKERVVKTVGELNGKYSQISSAPPIQFIYYSVNTNKLAALYSLADVGLVLPLIDGMNLVAKEFVAVQPGSNDVDPNPLQRSGALILSEFTGASSELYNAITVNPHDARGVSDAIAKALAMDPREKMRLNQAMRHRTRTQDADYWANRFLQELGKKTVVVTEIQRVLPVDEITHKFQKSAPGKKVLFLDYDGTLVQIAPMPELAVPTKRLMDILNNLTSREDLDVYIISGRQADFLDKHFSKLKRINLVAEHGYRVKHAGGEWEMFKVPLVVEWKPQILSYLEMYVRDTPGSFIEEKHSALVWHYRKSELELGQQRAADLVGQLSEFVNNLPVEIHHGKKIVEVSSIEIGKGRVVEKYLRKYHYEIALCVGDDTTDENMFRIPNEKLIKIKVGPGSTCAPFRWQKVDHVLEFLEKIQQ